MPGTKDAQEGTVAHKLGSLCLAEGHDPHDFVSRFIDGHEVDEVMADAIAVYVRYVRKQFTDGTGQIDLVHRCTLETEKWLSLAKVDPDCAGTADAIVYNRDTQVLHVTDLKYGAGVPIEAKDNRQLMVYGLGALIQLKEPVKLVRLTIVQPRADHSDGPIRTWNVSPAELRDFGDELRQAAQRTREADPGLQDGPWCQFCDAAGICPRLNGVASEAATLEAEDAALASTGGALEPDELGRRLALIDRLQFWATGVRKYAWAEAQRGRVPAGFKLVAVRGKRRWKDGGLAMRQAVRAFPFDVSEDDVFTRKPVTPRQLEKLVGERQAAEFVVAHTAPKRRSVSLVPASDKRPAVLPEALAEFDDLIDEGTEDDGEA